MGRRTPAIAASCVDHPATALTTWPAATGPADVSTPTHVSPSTLHPRDRDALMDVDAPTGGGLRVPPDDRVVPGERAGRVVRRAEHRQLAAAAEVDQRTHLEDLVGSEDVGLHAERPVQGGLLPLDLQGVLRVAEIELSLGAELDVESELLRQPSVAARGWPRTAGPSPACCSWRGGPACSGRSRRCRCRSARARRHPGCRVRRRGDRRATARSLRRRRSRRRRRVAARAPAGYVRRRKSPVTFASPLPSCVARGRSPRRRERTRGACPPPRTPGPRRARHPPGRSHRHPGAGAPTPGRSVDGHRAPESTISDHPSEHSRITASASIVRTAARRSSGDRATHDHLVGGDPAGARRAHREVARLLGSVDGPELSHGGAPLRDRGTGSGRRGR